LFRKSKKIAYLWGFNGSTIFYVIMQEARVFI